MRLLLDTHAFLWWSMDPERLSAVARDLMSDRGNQLLLSTASTWEIAIKVSKRRLPLPEPIERLIPRVVREESLVPLLIEQGHALRVAGLPNHHRDPFDRLLVAQAQAEGLPLLSRDRDFDAYDVERIW